MLEELHNEFPSVPQHKYRLACACERLGAMLRRDPAQQQDAEQYLRRAAQLLTELARDFPDTPDYHSHLAAALDGLMALPRSMIQLEEARQLIDVAIERQTAAVQANPAHRQYREYLAAHFGNLAAVLEQLGEHDGVDRAYVRRIELLHELVNEDPRRYEHELRTSELAYADWLSLHGEYDRATQLYEELIGVCSAPQASDSNGVGDEESAGWRAARSGEYPARTGCAGRGPAIVSAGHCAAGTGAGR